MLNPTKRFSSIFVLWTALLASLLAGGLAPGMSSGLVQAQGMSDQCTYKLLPIYGGGAGKENVNCFVYDEKNELIIFGGNTTSENFSPAANDHGYLIALDLEGNWVWGKFFYNLSYALSDVSGCQLSSDGESLSVMGMGNSQPVLMELQPANGQVNRYISLEWVGTTDDVVPKYKTYGSILLDRKDSYDGRSYFYSAFLMDQKIEMVRVLNSATPVIDWSYEFYDYTVDEALEFKRLKDPALLMEDPRDPSEFYLAGRYQGNAAIMRFEKRMGRLRWWARFDQLSNIRGWVQVPEDPHFYACGDYNVENQQEDLTLAVWSGAIIRMMNDGTVKFYMTVAGTNPGTDGVGAPNADRCMGLTIDPNNGHVTALLQIKMMETRYFEPANYYDTLLMQFDQSGTIERSVSISNGGELKYDMFLAQQGIASIKGQPYFAGWSYGFSTKFQKQVADLEAPDFDFFVYHYQWEPGPSFDCIYAKEVNNGDMRDQVFYYSATSFRQANLMTMFNKDSDVRKTLKDDYFKPYNSRYSGGFSLLDSMVIPRPCAYKSFNLTQVDYYRGQNPLQYQISSRNSEGFVVTMMDQNSALIFPTGKNASELAWYDQSDYSIYVQTDDETMVGTQQVIVRNCDSLNRLLELNLYINVLSNTHPDFTETVRTNFQLAVNQVEPYKLPPVEDPNSNDIPEVYVAPMEAQEDRYPPFLIYDNSTRTITFRPTDIYSSGQTYYFTIVIKEENSASVKFVYYCTINMEGEIILPDTTINYTYINYTINWLSDESTGSLAFNTPVNVTFLEENFYKMFDVFWRDTLYRTNRENRTLLDFEITSWGVNVPLPGLGEPVVDNRTFNFTMTFAEPYKIGLLLKKHDKLFINIKEDFNYTGMFLGNVTEIQLTTLGANKKIGLIFDWANPTMALMRSIAANTYWVMIGIIGVQFAMLIIRGIGLLPLWILIEYLQLVSFLPIYNFRLIPYLYDAFKPALVSHFIIFDETPFYNALDDDFFNKNYEYYWLSVGRLFQSFFFMGVILFCIVTCHGIVAAISKDGSASPSLKRLATSFKFNAYLRYYQLIYFGSTFFSVMKIIEGNNTTTPRKAALLLSYVLFVVNIILPCFLITLIYRRFEILKIKEAKQSFNTLITHIDKASRYRVANPAYFFFRRLVTAILLTLPIDNTLIFLQYVFVLMSSHAYILYLVALKPYQTAGINSYVLANETFYSALIIAIFIFSDATPELNIKFGAGVALMASLVLLVLANILINIAYMIRGKPSIKHAIKTQKLRRAEKEALERAEEEERRLKQKKEQEEFTKLPDETIANASQLDNSTSNINTMQELNEKSHKKGGKHSKDGKLRDDNVTDGFDKSGQSGLENDEISAPASKKRKHRRDKNKNKADDVTEGTIGEPTPDEEPQSKDEKRRKKRRREDGEGRRRRRRDADLPDHQPTTKDFL